LSRDSLTAMGVLSAFRTTRRPPLIQTAKATIAMIAAWLIVGWLIPGQLPVFAAIAAILVVLPSVNQSFGRAVERSIGVVLGVLVATGIALLFGQNRWIILVTIVVAMIVSWVLKVTTTTSNQVAISAMLVLALGSASPQYALDRVIETVIGVMIGCAVNALVVAPVAIAPVVQAVAQLGNAVADGLERLAIGLEHPQSGADVDALMAAARELRPIRDAAERAIHECEESLTFNPRGSAHRPQLDAMTGLVGHYSPIVTQIIGMTRAYRDHYDSALHTDAAVAAIAEQLRRAANDARRVVTSTTEVRPALTAPLVIITPGPHWILVGALLEDLRRIRLELLDEV